MRYITSTSISATMKRSTSQSKSLLSIVIMLSLSLMLAISGCSDDATTSETKTATKTETKENPKQLKKDISKDISNEEVNKPNPRPVTIYQVDHSKIEDLNDKSSYDMPRMQFLWETPFGKEEGLWSIKIDGTDLRRVMPYGELYKDHKYFGLIKKTPMRSPNNRYIAVPRYGKDTLMDAAIMIYDMLEKKWIYLESDNRFKFYTQYIVWLPDSSGFYWEGGGSKTYLYTLADNNISQIPIKNGFFHLKPNGNFISSYGKNGQMFFVEIDNKGNTNREFSIPLVNTGDNDGWGSYQFNLHGFDISGDYIFFSEKHSKWRKFPTKGYIFDVKKNKVLKETDEIGGDILYASISKDIVYSFNGLELLKSQPSSGKTDEIVFLFKLSVATDYPRHEMLYNLGDLAYEH